ncbi:TOM1-like protein 2 [Coccinella septempunctata]|uniref:TOM1-like protein 2 n=1 Tax=Coccinella septempunctata TaxID=41139 RepID=UPI001D08DC0D|nr:TOM1-like protein 2 [Coccinella septempunctata]
MTSFFGNALGGIGAIGGNPFATPIGMKVEQATDGSLASENWALNMEICDLVNESEEGPRDAIKAIRRRLVQNVGKNYTIIMYTLIVLETCVKNCGKRFQVLVCTKDFIQELVKLIGPKNDPPTVVQEKVLSLIQAWADAFQNVPEMSGVVSTYKDLKAKGIEFPATDLDALAPIHTPKRSVNEQPVTLEPQTQTSPTRQVASPTGGLSPEQRAKLQSELDVVQSNMNVLGEMLSEMTPGKENVDELELLQELNIACHSMQERLMELISRLPNDELTAELLRINDDMNNLFLRYSRWEKNRDAKGQSPSAIISKAFPPMGKPTLEASDSLIDFDDDLPEQLSKLSTSDATASSQLSKINTVSAKNSVKPEDDFDMFAQSRNVTYESSKTSGSTYEDNLEPNQVSGGLSSLTSNPKSEELEFHEMANWLGATGGNEESVTSSEFERFLAERAAAAESIAPLSGTQNAPKKEEGHFPL